jgi:DNA polymerase zeta
MAIFYTFHDEDMPLDQNSPQFNLTEGALLMDCPQFASHQIPGAEVRMLSDELDIMQAAIDLVHELDPDVLAGWEVQMSSWGYLRARCRSYGQLSWFGLMHARN